MSILFWLAGFIVLMFLSPSNSGNVAPIYFGGILGGLLPFIPSILGVVGSLFKGKKAQYTPTQNPQQAQAYQQLLSQLMSRMRGGFSSPTQTQGQQSIGRLNNMFWK